PAPAWSAGPAARSPQPARCPRHGPAQPDGRRARDLSPWAPCVPPRRPPGQSPSMPGSQYSSGAFSLIRSYTENRTVPDGGAARWQVAVGGRTAAKATTHQTDQIAEVPRSDEWVSEARPPRRPPHVDDRIPP